MARIANKKTGRLTKKYRGPSVFHTSTRKRKKIIRGGRGSMNYPSSNELAQNLIVVFLCVVMYFVPAMIPLIVGGVLIIGVDKICKSKWNVPSNKQRMPISWTWLILSAFEMIIAFFMVLLIMIEEVTWNALLINLLVYVIVSVWILGAKYKKIKSNGS